MHGLADPKVGEMVEYIVGEQQRIDDVEQPKLLKIVRARTTPWTPGELVEACAPGYYAAPLPICRMLYTTVRAMRPERVVEFGTSYGLSTLHIAAALRDNGGGRVTSVEMHEGKAAAARENIAEAGLSDHVEIVVGEASQVLAEVPGPVDFLYLDGWAEFYLSVLKAVEPKLRSGALVHADDTGKFAAGAKSYLDYVRDPANGYVSVEITDGQGLELSTYTGAGREAV
ncbi:O-methyltransferase [Longimycelium tulufanense]|uniref:O-methyltransferase n=1 Tax=Longimycelium tulufanense TaxID=907463 RepID=A0A8J3FUU0_9PSEU|nr:O-methyltransferase [Longimycelium tulufanense]